MKTQHDPFLKLSMEINDGFRKLPIYRVAKTYRGKNCFFTESQYTDIPVISPTPISKNHSSITILKHFVYRWQMNITAEF